jgi:hypothetical protein
VVLLSSSSASDSECPLTVGLDSVTPVSHVRDLGIYVDADLSIRTHISKTVASCFGVLHKIRSIRRSVSRPTLVALVTSLVMTRLDYGSAELAGLPRLLTDRLQAVLNGAAPLINADSRSDHLYAIASQPPLVSRRATERINFRLAVLACRCLHGPAPSYLAASGGGRLGSTTAAFFGDGGFCCSTYQLFDNRRSRLPRRRLTGLEQSSTVSHLIANIICIPEAA